MNLTQKPPLGLKVKADGKDPARLAAIHALPCCICHEYGMTQESLTQAHHCIHGRCGTRKAPDAMTIPLCEGHHVGDFDKTKLALHRHPSKWKRLYGPDTDWIGWADARI